MRKIKTNEGSIVKLNYLKGIHIMEVVEENDALWIRTKKGWYSFKKVYGTWGAPALHK